MRGQKPAAHITIPCLSLLHADSGGSHGGLRSPRLSFSPVSKICTNLYKSWVSARSPFASAESWGFLLGLMWIRRASALLRGIRCPRRFAAPRMLLRAGSAPSSSLTSYCGSDSGFCWNKHRLHLMLGIIISGQTVIILGSNQNSVFAQDASVAEEATENDQGQVYVTGLRKIEDGSVISNGKLDEAEKFFQAALDEATKGFGAKDPHVASSCNNLAELYRVKKAYEKAEPLYLEAINILEDTFGAVDVRVGAALHNLGQFYLALRKLEQARKCYERALKIKGRVLGYGHTEYADTMYHLGRVLHLQGKEKEAEDLIRESIRILEEAGLGESATCIRRMRYLTQIPLNSNRLAEAENFQRKILHILELSKGWDSIDTVIAAENLALTLQSLGNLIEAKELLERCLAARQKIFPQNHVQVAANMLHLARVAMLNSNNLRKVKVSEASGELDNAKLLLNTSVRIVKDILGSSGMNQNSFKSSNSEGEKDRHVALIIQLQSLDSLGLLDVQRRELVEARETFEYPIEVEHALRDCISIFKEPCTRSMVLDARTVKKEYLSCLKHLRNLATTTMEESQKSIVLQELIDEAQRIEAELLPRRH
ncbi:Kinesin light chain [Musa troglodytarum]|uniref:Kinesin light chain n=1 Tax=Musa troglodytarum TaxID=320322 RepID=A0A9E7GRT0_9LILI|nr:Kinesin light chain [Musa troglodytarum]